MHSICSDFNGTLKADSFISQSLRVFYVCGIGTFSHPMTTLNDYLKQLSIYGRRCSFFLFLGKTIRAGRGCRDFLGQGLLGEYVTWTVVKISCNTLSVGHSGVLLL